MTIHTPHNPTLSLLIKEILNKEITPNKIYKAEIGNKYTIEVENKDPKNFTSILYDNQLLRDKDYMILDKEVFDILEFNPNIS